MTSLATQVPVVRTGIRLDPDPSRVVTRLFVAGQEDLGPGESRASVVVARVLALSDGEVEANVAELQARFGSRHRDLDDAFESHADRIAYRLDTSRPLSPARRLLLGATFTNEYAVEAAAVCNPSMVEHPDQRGCAPGEQRFVMSVRGIGEGHRSSIGFRTGVINPNGAITVDPPSPFAAIGRIGEAQLDRAVLHGNLHENGHRNESAAFALRGLGDRFDRSALEARLALLARQRDTRRDTEATVAHIRSVADATYSASFDPAHDVSERVLWPHAPAESNGMEDARFVRFTDDDGQVVYYATYTAFDGRDIHQHMARTTDFAAFDLSPVAGSVAHNKGLALFPRRVGGRYWALARTDRETNEVMASDELSSWPEPTPFQSPRRSWETIQIGNCGSPIETEAGWLVLTHGVGAMRTYRIGAVLLDLDDPTRVIRTLDGPLVTPTAEEQDGYVPNVVYSCGALLHDGLLVIPYGIGDQRISIATARCADVLGAMR